MSETGITAFGAYVPWRRFERQAMARNTAWYNQEVAAARGERAWCGWDEDVFTMAVEAVRDCLPAQAARERLSAVLLATTTAPFADRSGAAIVREAAGLPAGALCLDVGGSYRAGTSALLSALRLASGEDAPVLCVAAEQVTSAPASTEELQSGDAAAAFVTGTRDVIAEYLGGHSTAADFVDHFRPRDSMHNYFWETRWARDEGVLSLVPAAVREALRASGINAADVDRFILPVPIKNAAASAAKRIGIPVESVDTGLARPGRPRGRSGSPRGLGRSAGGHAGRTRCRYRVLRLRLRRSRLAPHGNPGYAARPWGVGMAGTTDRRQHVLEVPGRTRRAPAQRRPQGGVRPEAVNAGAMAQQVRPAVTDRRTRHRHG